MPLDITFRLLHEKADKPAALVVPVTDQFLKANDWQLLPADVQKAIRQAQQSGSQPFNTAAGEVTALENGGQQVFLLGLGDKNALEKLDIKSVATALFDRLQKSGVPAVEVETKTVPRAIPELFGRLAHELAEEAGHKKSSPLKTAAFNAFAPEQASQILQRLECLSWARKAGEGDWLEKDLAKLKNIDVARVSPFDVARITSHDVDGPAPALTIMSYLKHGAYDHPIVVIGWEAPAIMRLLALEQPTLNVIGVLPARANDLNGHAHAQKFAEDTMNAHSIFRVVESADVTEPKVKGGAIIIPPAYDDPLKIIRATLARFEPPVKA